MRRPLTLKQVLAWADAHHERTGRWPTKRAGSVRQAPGENWAALDAALKRGHRGLAAGLSLAGRLARDRQVRNSVSKPRLKIKQILAWADAHHSRTGKWPVTHSGSIHEAPAENWCALSQALDKGARGLPAGASLAKLLAKYGRRRNQRALRPLTVKQVLAWADAHHKRTGQWPTKRSVTVRGAPGETWTGIASSMRVGYRGFPGGQSLRGLLMERRGARHPLRLPQLTVRQILAWADAHHQHTGKWPTGTSGPILDRKGLPTEESWAAIEDALNKGRRGLAGCTTLPVLIARHRGGRRGWASQRLTVRQVMLWADAHHDRTGKWPTVRTGPIPKSCGETWRSVDSALTSAVRWQADGTTLAELLARRRNKQHPRTLPRLTIKQILAWADQHYRRTGGWPKAGSGRVPGSGGETWSKIKSALMDGCRGFAGGLTLPQLLEERRGVRNTQHLQRLTIKQVLKWADAHHRRTGRWPTPHSGAIPDSDGETWNGIQAALFVGHRGFHGGFTLAKFLDKHRGVRNTGNLPALKIHQILRWADGRHKRTGKWPKNRDGRVPEAPGEKWSAIHAALEEGLRGLRGGSSLARLLSEHRGVRNIQHLPRLTIKRILKWIDAHHKRTGRWPKSPSGAIPDSNGETWNGIQAALVGGHRGFRGGFTLAKFLDKHRGVRNTGDLPALKIHQILRWADGHHKRTGEWPKDRDGRVPEARGEKWSAIDAALVGGLRGLPGGSSLPRLLSKHRGVRNIHDLPRLPTKQILKWADAFHKREKAWPRRDSGRIPRSGGENWEAINHALKKGNRGLSGGWSLYRFLNRYRRPERGL